MSDADIAEMQRLRASNPAYYTRKRLAEKFNCSPSFPGLVARLPRAEHRAALKKVEAEHADVRAQWGERKLITHQIRRKRKEFW